MERKEKLDAGEAVAAAQADMIEIDPRELKVIPKANSRVFGASEEAKADLKRRIKAQGLIEPIVVTPVDEKEKKFRLIIGYRRHEVLCELWDEGHKVKTLAAVRRDLTPQGEFELNLAENIERADLTPAEQFKAIQRFREEFGLKGEKHTEEVARKMGFFTKGGKPAVATVTQLERLAALTPKELRMVHEYTLGVQAAIDLSQVSDDPKIREKVLGRAEEIEEEKASKKEKERRAKADAKAAAAGKGKPAKAAAATKSVGNKKPPKGPRAVSSGSVRKASREMGADTKLTAKGRSMQDWLDMLEPFETPGMFSAPMVEFAEMFKAWQKGGKGDKELLAVMKALAKASEGKEKAKAA